MNFNEFPSSLPEYISSQIIYLIHVTRKKTLKRLNMIVVLNHENAK